MIGTPMYTFQSMNEDTVPRQTEATIGKNVTTIATAIMVDMGIGIEIQRYPMTQINIGKSEYLTSRC
jgi:hypothetical protein